MTQRDLSSDALRGWAILGVVAIHATDFILPQTAYGFTAAYFRWAVPVFIILSAYFSLRSLRDRPESYRAFVQRRLGALLLPFIVYSLIYFLLTVDLSTLSIKSLVTHHFSGYGWSGQYFFIILFQLIPLYPLLSRRALSLRVVLVVFALAFALFPVAQWGMGEIAVLGAINDRLFVYWLPYVIWGAYLAQHETAWRRRVERLPRIAAFGGVAVLPLSIVAFYNPHPGGSLYVLPSVLLTAFLLIPLASRAFQYTSPNLLSYLGRRSLVVFCLNPLIILLLERVRAFSSIPAGLPLIGQVLLAAALVGFITLCCVLIGELLKRLGLNGLVF